MNRTHDAKERRIKHEEKDEGKESENKDGEY